MREADRNRTINQVVSSERQQLLQLVKDYCCHLVALTQQHQLQLFFFFFKHKILTRCFQREESTLSFPGTLDTYSHYLHMQGEMHFNECEIQWADWPTADLILLSLTVALLLPEPRRPCSLLTCLVTPCRLVLTSSITVAELGVCCFFFFTLLTSGMKHMAKREAENSK